MNAKTECTDICHNIRSRCNKVIRYTNANSLEYGRSTLGWMLKKIDSKRLHPGLPYLTDKKPEDDSYTVASLLYNNIDVFNLDDPNNLSWSQYFSLLGLTVIQQAHYYGEILQQRLPVGDHPAFSYTMGCHVAEAMEAVTISEIMALDPCHKCLAVEYSEKKVYSLKKARNAISKLQLISDLESDLIRFWSNGRFNNKTDAARRYHQLVYPGKAEADNEKVIRKFVGTITQYEKAINKIIDLAKNKM